MEKRKEKFDLIKNQEYQQCLECKRKAEEVLQEIFQTRAKENTFWAKRYNEEMLRLNILNDKIKKFEQDNTGKGIKKRRVIFNNGVSCIFYGDEKEIRKNNRGIFAMYEIINNEI